MKRTSYFVVCVLGALALDGCAVLRGAGNIVTGTISGAGSMIAGTASWVANPGDWKLWGGERLPRPNLAVGDRWVYHVVETDSSGALLKQNEYDIAREIERLAKKEIAVREQSRAFSGQPQVRSFDPYWNPLEESGTADSVIKFDPFKPTFDFPLRPGKDWGQNFTWSRPGTSDDGAARTEAKIVGFEKVTVPVGEFNAMKVELLTPYFIGSDTSKVFSDRRNYGGMSEIYWYSSELKNFIKYMRKEYVNDKQVAIASWELIDYRVGLRVPGRK
jgi:hypothetical protein